MSNDIESEPTAESTNDNLLPVKMLLTVLFPPLYQLWGSNVDWTSPSAVYDKVRWAFDAYRKYYLLGAALIVAGSPLAWVWTAVVPHIAIAAWVVGVAMGQFSAVPVSSPISPFVILIGLAWGLDVGPVRRWLGSSGSTDLPSFSDAASEGYALPIRTERGDHQAMALRDDLSIGAIGESGSGKTNTIYHLLAQIRPDASIIAFDYKDDYGEFFRNYQFDRDIETISISGSTAIWNIFSEIEQGKDPDELARLMFRSSGGDEYFSRAGRQVFSGVLKLIDREAPAASAPDNADLVRFFETNEASDAYDKLSDYDDLTPAAQHLDPDAEGQSSGVWATVQGEVLDAFKGDFAAADGRWTVSQAVHTPRIVTLFDYDPSRGASTEPIFRLLVDLAAQEALSDQSEQFFVLDEFQTLPALENVERLVNVGRAKNIGAVFGLQSVGQLQQTYGRSAANSLLAGMPQLICHRPGDSETIDLIQDRVGKQRQTVESYSESTDPLQQHGSVSRRETDRTPIPSATLTDFEVGQTVVIGDDWWSGAFVREATLDVIAELREAKINALSVNTK